MVRFTSLLVAALSAGVASAADRRLDDCSVDATPMTFPVRVTDEGPFKAERGQGCTVLANPKCFEMGFDYGYKIQVGNSEGCKSYPAGTAFTSTDKFTATGASTNPSCTAPSGTVETTCIGEDKIKLTSSEDTYVFVKAQKGGTVYKVAAGDEVTLDYGGDDVIEISHVEFCFNCDEAPFPSEGTPVAPAPAPTTAAPVTAAPVTAAPVTAAPVTAAPVTAAPVTAAPVTAATPTGTNAAVDPGATCVKEADMAVPTLSLYELALKGKEDHDDEHYYFPDCGDLGQNEPFQGKQPLLRKQGQTEVCAKVNICHGNAGFGWNRITVDRDAIGIDNNGQGGHAKDTHNDRTKNKRPDFFPGGYSVPNPNGAGANGYLDGACNFIPSCESGDEPIPGEDVEVTDAPTGAPAPDSDLDADNADPKAFTRGDPHFKTFGGELYDYHGQCDMVLLSNPDFKNGLGMTVHIRTKIQDFWSSVESAAIKIGEDFLEVAGGEGKEWIWVNGEANEVLEEETWYRTSLAGFLVRFKQTGSVKEANIYLEGAKEVLVIKTYHDFVRVDINWVDSENYGGSVGLLGAKDKEGVRVGRDGTEIKDVNAFGQEWQVKEDEDKLFHNYDPTVIQAPAKCVLPPSMTDEKIALRKRRLAESDLTEEKAEKACEHVQGASERKACVYDILATQDINMAGAW